MCIVEENTPGKQGEPQSWSGRLSFARIKPRPLSEFYICGSVHHQSVLLNNQRDAALSSRITNVMQF
jgi:hypothetical protein